MNMVLNIPKTEVMLIGTVQRLQTAINKISEGDHEYQITKVNHHKL